MIFFLKNDKDDILFEAELWVKMDVEYSYIELDATLDIKNYSQLLLKNHSKSEVIIRDFTHLSQLRGWLWERCFGGSVNDPTKIDEISEKLKIMIEKVANTHNLTLKIDDITR